MPEKKPRYAIRGAGWAAGEHPNAYMANSHRAVVAVGSRQETPARAAGCAVCTVYAELFKGDRVQVRSICIPDRSS